MRRVLSMMVVPLLCIILVLVLILWLFIDVLQNGLCDGRKRTTITRDSNFLCSRWFSSLDWRNSSLDWRIFSSNLKIFCESIVVELDGCCVKASPQRLFAFSFPTPYTRPLGFLPSTTTNQLFFLNFSSLSGSNGDISSHSPQEATSDLAWENTVWNSSCYSKIDILYNGKSSYLKMRKYLRS